MASSTCLFGLLLLLLPFAVAAADLRILHYRRATSSGAAPSDSPLAVSAAAVSDPARLTAILAARNNNVNPSIAPVASGQSVLQSSSYVVRAAIGSPPQPLLLAVDTAADATWAPCSPCATCPSSSAQFMPSNSTSYSSLSCSSALCPLFSGQAACPGVDAAACSFTQTYADATFTAALAQDSLALGRDVIRSFAFGCVGAVDGPATNLPRQGLLGLGRGAMSLLSQAGDLYHGVFSYCLPSFKSYYFSGSLRLGAAGQPRGGIRYTPLLKNPHRPSLYYVNVTGLSVGRTLVAVPEGSFAFDPYTGAGTVVDSGTVITRWTTPVYAALRDEFRRQVAAPGGYTSLGAFDTCFDTAATGASVPAVTVHMDGGVDLTLAAESTVIHSSATPLACLAMAEAPANVNAVVNVIASLQQQNLRVVVDAGNERLGFGKEVCN